MQVKQTKTELRSQQLKFNQLQKYLPTLQLKKMLLQLEVNLAAQEIEEIRREFDAAYKKISAYARLFTDPSAFELFSAVKILEVQKKYENIAGIDVPILDKVVFDETEFMLFDSPVWLDTAIADLRGLLTLREKMRVGEEKKAALEKELRDVSIRVNLFEKVLIPRAQEIIRKIKIFLGDQQLAAVCQAKVAKQKIVASYA
jgi:V/A-type H+-transporting ATPase subunit D